MATTITLLKATPYSAAYQLTGDGAEGTLLGPALLATLAEGPLKRVLTAAVNGGTCDTSFNLGGFYDDFVRTYTVNGINGTIPTPVAPTVRWVPTGLSATLDALAKMNIEIRYRHSRDR